MEGVSLAKKGKGKYEKYELESCAETLMRAEEIKADEEKMKALKPYLAKKVKALKEISSIADLKNRAKEINEEDEEDGES